LIATNETTGYTDGGNFTSGAWQTRAFTNTRYSQGTAITRSGNAFILNAGKYRVTAFACAVQVDKHITRIRQTSGTPATLAIGSCGMADSTGTLRNDQSTIEMVFDLAAQQTIELQHRCETTKVTDGLGYGGNVNDSWSEANVFNRIHIIKIG
jgi:hypothetical protein